MPTKSKKLISLDSHNNFARTKNRALQNNNPVLNGIACPKCGEELYDSNPMETFTSNPPQKRTKCSNEECDYNGYRIC